MKLTNIVYMSFNGGELDYYYYAKGDNYISFIVDLQNNNIKHKPLLLHADIVAKYIKSLDKEFE